MAILEMAMAVLPVFFSVTSLSASPPRGTWPKLMLEGEITRPDAVLEFTVNVVLALVAEVKMPSLV